MEYLCSVNNYVDRARLGNRFPYEAFWGETPDISMIWFKFWEPVYYWNWTETASKVFMHPGRFMGFAWSTGDPMTFKVLQCHANPKRRSRVLHRGTVVPRALDVVGYNSALQPKSDAYFPVVKPDDGISGKALTSVLQGTVHPPDNTTAEEGGKRRRISSQSSAVMRTGRSTITAHAVVDKPSSTENESSSATDDQGDMNEEGATDEIC